MPTRPSCACSTAGSWKAVAALRPGMTAEESFHAADARLFVAGRHGRNQVAAWGPRHGVVRVITRVRSCPTDWRG